MKRTAITLLLTVAAFLGMTGHAQATQPVPVSFFGIHGDTAGFGAVRLWDSGTTWADLEPQPGQWQWGTLDTLVQHAQANHERVLLTLGTPPLWATGNQAPSQAYKGASTAPSSLSDWWVYVNAVSQRYAGRISAYETWNEPDLPMYYSGDAATLAHLSSIAYRVIKANDPSATVLSPAFSHGGYTMLGRMLSVGAARYMDGIAYHPYPIKNDPESVFWITSRFRTVESQYGVSKPLWGDETGLVNPSIIGMPSLSEAQIRTLAGRLVVNLLRCGVTGIDWYALDGDWSESLHEHPLEAQGIATLQQWLVGSRVYGWHDSPDRRFHSVVVQRGQTRLMVWRTGEPGSMLAATTTTIRTLDGTTHTVRAGQRFTIPEEPMLLSFS